MIDERIRIQENYDMILNSDRRSARRRLSKVWNKAEMKLVLQLIREMVSRGMSPELISNMTGLSIEEIKALLS